MQLQQREHLAPELRALVSQSVDILGGVIEREFGPRGFATVEEIRRQMTGLRDLKDDARALKTLEDTYRSLSRLQPTEMKAIATSFTLMLQLMNACENAYRSHRLSLRAAASSGAGAFRPSFMIYVLTAHPTEARSPENIEIFHRIQKVLIHILDTHSANLDLKISASDRSRLHHLLEVAWRVPIVRSRAPKVKDEAEHVNSMLFRDDVLASLLDLRDQGLAFYVRSWVGGDKDGHPGVDEKTLLESLTLSRNDLIRFCLAQTAQVRATLELFRAPGLAKNLAAVDRGLRSLRAIKAGDGRRLIAVRRRLARYCETYEREMHAPHPNLKALHRLMQMFPALVVPLELRESSDVLMTPTKGRKPAIERMLMAVAKISTGGDPRWYARGFIISMAESIEHIRAAAHLQRKVFGDVRIPIIPLFEEAKSLKAADDVVRAMIRDRSIASTARKFWDGMIEIMVGYSDSMKESGALASRLSIAQALPKLEKVITAADFIPIFFHGSGGSVDRGGGTVEDQTDWWPKSALKRYKVTVQGEMVERSLATPEIARGQIQHIAESVGHVLAKISAREVAAPKSGVERNIAPALERFAEAVAGFYRDKIRAPAFLDLVEKATPYSYLSLLKMGSRPSKRAGQFSISALRAIPWVLCWTQTRVLFPTWWGVGSAWNLTNEADRRALKAAFAADPVFTSYVRALGFTLAKIELPVWRLYLNESRLAKSEAESAAADFTAEFDKTVCFFRELTGKTNFLWFRPWLGESIRLRSSMIHPLNCLQILAEKRRDADLLRITVTGISSGMLTTG